jgi:hypothetical protein
MRLCTPIAARAVEIFEKPGLLAYEERMDTWEEHFRWSQSWTKLLGRTAIRRAPVLALDMNAKLLQKARPFWRVAGLIP